MTPDSNKVLTNKPAVLHTSNIRLHPSKHPPPHLPLRPPHPPHLHLHQHKPPPIPPHQVLLPPPPRPLPLHPRHPQLLPIIHHRPPLHPPHLHPPHPQNHPCALPLPPNPNRPHPAKPALPACRPARRLRVFRHVGRDSPHAGCVRVGRVGHVDAGCCLVRLVAGLVEWGGFAGVFVFLTRLLL